jgi:hypothetical protein
MTAEPHFKGRAFGSMEKVRGWFRFPEWTCFRRLQSFPHDVVAESFSVCANFDVAGDTRVASDVCFDFG